MKDIVSNFREQYDYVFIDSPPISRMNDACIITQYVDGTIVTVVAVIIIIFWFKFVQYYAYYIGSHFV